MANTSTLIRTIPFCGGSSFKGNAEVYHIVIDTIDTYVNIASAAPDSAKFHAILGLIVGQSSTTTLTFGLSASVNFPIKGISGPHGIPIGDAVYIPGTNGYRIQVKSNVICDILVTIVETGAIRV